MGTVNLQQLSGRDQSNMRPFVALSLFLACAMGAPSYGPAAAVAAAPVAVAHAAVAPVAHTAAVTQSVAPANLAAHPLQAGAVVPHPVNYVAPPAPAPYTTSHQGPGTTTIHQPAPVVTKEVHYGQTDFVSGYSTRILKPPTPHLPISVPTVLKGSVAYNAPIVKEQVEVHNVQNPVLVERRVEVPCDVPVYQENIVQVPTPVHVDAPYNVPYPVAVPGEPIIKKTVSEPIVTHSAHHVNAGVTGVAHAGVAHAGVVHAGYAHAGYAHAGYAAAPAAAYVH